MNPRVKFVLSLLAVILLSGCISQQEKLACRRIDELLSSPLATNNDWSVLITDRRGRVCYQTNASRASVPASNEKLFTVSGAFGLLGTNHSFETRIYLDGVFSNSVLKGDVNLVCEHDITWNWRVFPSNAAAPLEYIATQLKARGLKSIQGKVQCYGACFYVPDRDGGSGGYGYGRRRGSRNPSERNRRAAVAFQDALSSSGIAVTTNAALGQEGFTAPGKLFYTYESTNLLFEGAPLTLQTACIPLLKHSENTMADGLLRHIGYKLHGEDSYAAGALSVKDWLSRTAKVNTNAQVMADGSGLSEDDAVSAAQVVSLLRYMLPHYPSFARALPISCVDGTLASRFCDTPAAGRVHAKTGTLRTSIDLSGYTANPDGTPRYIFSILANNEDSIDATAAHKTIDNVVTELIVTP